MSLETFFHAGVFPKVPVFQGVLAGLITHAEIDNEDEVKRTGESHSRGVEVGGVNYAESLTGVQSGVINWADMLYGIQIGAVNVSFEGNYLSLGLLNIRPNAKGWYRKVVPFVRINFE